MSELVLEIDQEVLELLEDEAESLGISAHELATQIFKKQMKRDLAEITPTTFMLASYMNNQ